MKVFVKVKPGSSVEKIEKVSSSEFVVWIKEKAQDGKANLRLVRLLAGEFGVSVDRVKIKNSSSRKKVVEILEGKV